MNTTGRQRAGAPGRALALAGMMAALAGGPAAAELPREACFVRSYDAAHLAAHPAQGVAALRLWFFDETLGVASSRAVRIEALMADQGQGARDGVGGRVLSQYAPCEGGRCYVECDGGFFEVRALGPGEAGAGSGAGAGPGIEIASSRFVLGDLESCGGISDLAERAGQVTRYRLEAAPDAACATLARPHPLPGPGCYGVDYADMRRGQGVLGVRLRLGGQDEGHAFAQATGVLGVSLPDGGRARAAGMGGARLSLPVWCSSLDGRCQAGPDEGSFALAPEGEGAAISTAGFSLFGPEGERFDLAEPGAGETRHALRRLADSDCRALE